MSDIGIITDTVACLPDEIIKKYDICVIPFALNINGKSYLDQVDITLDEFWKMFPSIKEYSTGAPAQGIIINKFEEMSLKYKNLVCTFVSKQLSAMYESASQAREIFRQEHPEVNIELVDSRNCAGAQSFIVMEMAKAAHEGKSLAEVVKIGEETVPRIGYFCVMETLKYLIRSGRAPKTAYLGDWLQIKPVIGMVHNTGLVENLGKIRGKNTVIPKITEILADYLDPQVPARIFVHYTNSKSEGERLLEAIKNKFSCQELYLTPFSPIMCGHTGPVLGIGFIRNK